MIGSFGDKTFTVNSDIVYTPETESQSTEISVDEQEVDGSKPSSYIKSTLDSVSLSIKLSWNYVYVEDEIRSWKAICDSHEPHMLFMGDNPVSENKYLLYSVKATDILRSSNGTALKATLALEFKEYVREGTKESDSNTSSSSNKNSKTQSKVDEVQEAYK